MNFTIVTMKDIVNNYKTLGLTLNGHSTITSESTIDESTRRLYYANLKKELVGVIRENNNIQSDTDLYLSSMEDKNDRMKKLFRERIVCRTKYEVITQCMMFVTGDVTLEEFESNMLKIVSDEICNSVIEAEKKFD